MPVRPPPAEYQGTDIVDAHHHVWDLLAGGQDWITGDDLAPLRRSFLYVDYAPKARAAGVTASVVVQTGTGARETAELLALADRHDLIAGVVGWTDLTAPDVADRLAGLRELPGGRSLVGVRHRIHGEPDPRWLLRPDVLRGLRALAAAGLAFDLAVEPRHLPACVQAAKTVPHLGFVLEHLGSPPIAADEIEPWAASVRALAATPNTVCKLSGMVTRARWHTWTVADLRPYADVVFDAFGPDRLMFGSDWPLCTVAARYDKVVATARDLLSGLSEPERAAVFAQTAWNVYGLK